jgi:hypothetical protein
MVVRRCFALVAGGLKQIAARTPAHHQAEKKQQRFLEQKDSKASKVFGSVLKRSALAITPAMTRRNLREQAGGFRFLSASP